MNSPPIRGVLKSLLGDAFPSSEIKVPGALRAFTRNVTF